MFRRVARPAHEVFLVALGAPMSFDELHIKLLVPINIHQED